MHEPLLAQAALPARSIILGMVLRPYSLGHELFLLREQNPLATVYSFGQAGQVRPQDLAQAILICCQSFSECRAMVQDRFLGLKLWVWRRRLRKINFQRELAA